MSTTAAALGAIPSLLAARGPSSTISVDSQPTATVRASETPSMHTTDTPVKVCASFTLPSGGKVVLGPGYTVEFVTDVLYQPVCNNEPAFFQNSSLPIVDDRDPFYASYAPLIYVVAGCTFVAWFLFIMLLLLPGSYVGVTRRRATQPWPNSRNFFYYLYSRFPIGTARPWLQILAAIAVVVSMTTVTSDTFSYAKHQYAQGYMDADDLRDHVAYSNRIKILHIVSDIFFWLAQVQTLIKLFPRHKEKLLIKWIGFILILLDTIFECLTDFVIDNNNKPLNYTDSISALSYLFQLSMNLLYAAWVLYYSVTKRRFAFYHPLMPSISIVAIFALLSVATPVVFFLVDLAESPVGSWGDYFRWLGAAAASIVVWEWVERIEALERDEKKGGILGQEVYDEDEMDTHTLSDASSRSSLDGDGGYSSDTLVERHSGSQSQSSKWKSMTGRLAPIKMIRLTRKSYKDSPETRSDEESQSRPSGPDSDQWASADLTSQGPRISMPPRAASPVNRNQTTSTGSTVYAVHYHNMGPTPHPQPGPGDGNGAGESWNGAAAATGGAEEADAADQGTPATSPRKRWNFAKNVFRRSHRSPPIEIKNALSEAAQGGTSALIISRDAPVAAHPMPPRAQSHSTPAPAPAPTPVAAQEPTVIAAPPRGQLWSPDTQTHSPISRIQQGSVDSVAGSGRIGPSASQDWSTRHDGRTPTPVRLDGGQSAAYDFGNTPPLPHRQSSATAAESSNTSDRQNSTGSEQIKEGG